MGVKIKVTGESKLNGSTAVVVVIFFEGVGVCKSKLLKFKEMCEA